MDCRNNKSKGITLVALVITIIILLILAGITISQLTGSGLFEKAKQAREEAEKAQIKENATLAEYEDKVQEHIDGTRDTNGITADYKSDGTEIKTNEKFDGKPIYARYLEMEMSGGGWYSKEHNIENVDKIWIDAGNSYVNENDGVGTLPAVADGVSFKVNKEKVFRYSIRSWDTYVTTILLKYTKTTD